MQHPATPNVPAWVVRNRTDGEDQIHDNWVVSDGRAQSGGSGPSDECIAVQTFLDRIAYVGQWYEVARSYAYAVATRNELLKAVRQAAVERGRLEALDAAVARANAVPSLDAQIGEADLRQVREAIVEAAMALAVRDLIAPEQFWSLYQPFAPLIPVKLPLDWGKATAPMPSR